LSHFFESHKRKVSDSFANARFQFSTQNPIAEASLQISNQKFKKCYNQITNIFLKQNSEVEIKIQQMNPILNWKSNI